MQPKRREFIGRAYGAEELSILHAQQKRERRSARNLPQASLDDTEENRLLLDVARKLLDAEFRALGIRKLRPLYKNRVFFLKPDAFDEHFNTHTTGARGAFMVWEDIVLIKSDPSVPRIERLARLLHELVHQASSIRHSVSPDNVLSVARSGYRIRSSWKKRVDRTEALIALNEMVVEHTVAKMLNTHTTILQSELQAQESDLKSIRFAYGQYVDAFREMISRIATHYGTPASVIFSEFERGQFEPNLLILKKVEAAYGPGSVRVLAAMGMRERAGVPSDIGEKIDQFSILFFTSADAEERLAIALRIRHLFDSLPDAEDGGTESIE